MSTTNTPFASMAAPTDEEQRAAREEHNTTNCRLLMLPTELRDQIYTHSSSPY